MSQLGRNGAGMPVNVRSRARVALIASASILCLAGIAASATLRPQQPARAEPPTGGERAYPKGCVVGENGAQAFPRAGLAVANLSSATIRVRLEPRPIAGLAETNLGPIPPQTTQVFPNALPSGRNLLKAVVVSGNGAAPAASPQTMARIIYVTHHGEATCRRRYLWQIR